MPASNKKVKVFVDSDGRLTELLRRLKVETVKSPVAGPGAKGDFFQLAASGQDAPRLVIPDKTARRKTGPRLSSALLQHAIEVFGSEAAARRWMSHECGSLNNRTPLEVIHSDANEAEVERILSCIDYGMIA